MVYDSEKRPVAAAAARVTTVFCAWDCRYERRKRAKLIPYATANSAAIMRMPPERASRAEAHPPPQAENEYVFIRAPLLRFSRRADAPRMPRGTTMPGSRVRVRLPIRFSYEDLSAP